MREEQEYTTEMNKNAPQLMNAVQLCLKLIVVFSLWLRATQLVVCQQPSNGTQATIPLGESLLAGDLNRTAWVSSPNGNFSFGFYAIDSGEAPVNYKLGIWYTQLPVQTIVWGLVENDGPFGAGAKITLTTNGSLELHSSDASQGATGWSSNTAGLGVSGATLSDSGNFILLNNTGENLWQSWDSPSDTLLPGQTLPQGKALTAMVSPHISNTDVSPYTLSFKADTAVNLVLYFNKTTVYWSSESAGGTHSDANRVYFDALGDFQLLNSSAVTTSYRSRDYGAGPLRRVMLTSSGNLETLSWNNAASNWTATWEAFANECEIYGWCGRNGLCAYSETGPVCSCLPGYQFINSKSPRQGCGVMMDLNCTAGLKTVTLENTVLLDFTSDYLQNSANSESCARMCLVDVGTGGTACVVSTLKNEGSAYCKLKRTQFFSAYRSPFIPAQSFVKLCVDQEVTLDLLSLGTGSDNSRNSTGLVVALACVSALAGFFLLLLARPYLNIGKKATAIGRSLRRPPSPTPDYVPGAAVRLPYRALQKATKNFSEKLGYGGFGTVYKGVLENGTIVAVKQLEDVVEQGEREFRTEVSVIGSTHHVNLVHLHGYCTEKAHRLLVYEYLSNGSLDHYLVKGGDATTTSNSSLSSGSTASNAIQPRMILDWNTRFSIALGTARGIMYLHEECRECVVHCDIKPENILLDESFCPKVSDFGLAKLLGLRGRERHITTIRGTRGYLAPEWGSNLPLTAKADVYSYGMVLLELVVGRRALDATAGDAERVRFPTWVYREMISGSLVKSFKEQARNLGHKVDLDQVERTIFTAFWCIQDEPSARPSMGKVVQMLEGIVSIEPPPEPFTIRKL